MGFTIRETKLFIILLASAIILAIILMQVLRPHEFGPRKVEGKVFEVPVQKSGITTLPDAGSAKGIPQSASMETTSSTYPYTSSTYPYPSSSLPYTSSTYPYPSSTLPYTSSTYPPPSSPASEGSCTQPGSPDAAPSGPASCIPDDKAGLVAEEGDSIAVHYVMADEDGEIIDTTYTEIASESWGYDPGRRYSALKFTIGDGQVLAGLELGVQGMKIGEERILEIPPNKAFGVSNPDRLTEVSRTNEFFRDQNISLNDFIKDVGEPPVIGANHSISRLESDILWPFTVTSVTDELVFIRYHPPIGVLETYFGPANVTVSGDSLMIKVNPSVGEVLTPTGLYRISSVSEHSFTIDLNHPLAGKKLTMTVQMFDIQKADNRS
ncbi:peptidylprolyl isomerase [Candidatus Altiarchaeota archaeon]